MHNVHATEYIKEMMKGFQIPGSDAVFGCLLATQDGIKNLWDAEVIVSTHQSERFYKDIYQFWVRSFSFFIEDTWCGSIWQEMISEVNCRSLAPEDFRRDYLALMRGRVPDAGFLESQSFPETRVEMENRSILEAFLILDCAKIKSGVAYSDGEFLSYFVLGDSSLARVNGSNS